MSAGFGFRWRWCCGFGQRSAGCRAQLFQGDFISARPTTDGEGSLGLSAMRVFWAIWGGAAENFLCVFRQLQGPHSDVVHSKGTPGAACPFASVLLVPPFVQQARAAELQAHGDALRWPGRTSWNVTVGLSWDFSARDVSRHGASCLPRYRPGWVPPERLSRGEEPQGPGTKVALAIARSRPNKRHDLLFRAARLVAITVACFRLLLVGEVYGTSLYYDSLLQRVESMGLTGLVTFLPFTADIRPLEAAADVLISCSDREPLALSVLEAMAMDLPVVVSDSGGTQEMVQDRRTGFVAPRNDPEILADRVTRLLSNDRVARRMAESAWQYVRGHLHSKLSAGAVMEIYDSLVAERREDSKRQQEGGLVA